MPIVLLDRPQVLSFPILPGIDLDIGNGLVEMLFKVNGMVSQIGPCGVFMRLRLMKLFRSNCTLSR